MSKLEGKRLEVPFYEYRCAKCGRKTSLFKTSIAQATAAEASLKCEGCGSPALQRLLSRFAVGRAALDSGEELYHFDRMTAGLDAETPQELNRWVGSLSDQSDKAVPPLELETSETDSPADSNLIS